METASLTSSVVVGPLLDAAVAPDAIDCSGQSLDSTNRPGSPYKTSMLPPTTPRERLVRPLSLSSRANNRLSLSLPIQPADGDLFNFPRFTPTSSYPATRQASPSLDILSSASSDDSESFLVALAAQERKVLELKEEFSRAETELQKLKRQWALHEARRNSNRSNVDAKQMELRTMSPVASATATSSAEDDERNTKSLELDRRKAILAGSNNRAPRGKVISGGHTRTLSLLSPVQSSQKPGYDTSPLNKASQGGKSLASNAEEREVDSNSGNSVARKGRLSYQEGATTGVKQIAEDIKLGIWSFMEDLRQATVGEEAAKEASALQAWNVAQQKGGKNVGRRTQQGESVKSEVQRKLVPKQQIADILVGNRPSSIDANVATLLRKLQTPKKDKADTQISQSLDDDWSNWDSPTSHSESGRWSNSTSLSSHDEDSPSTQGPSVKPKDEPSNTASSPSKGEVIPWPDINSLTPSSIKRTATAMMKEWERSLIPSPEERNSNSSPKSQQTVRKSMDESETRLLLSGLA
jgi:hypothetical protein